MKMLVLGAGLQGSACAFDLLQDPEVTQVTLADIQPERMARVPLRAGTTRSCGQSLST